MILALVAAMLPASSANAVSGVCDPTAFSYATIYLPNVTKTLGGPDGWFTPFIVQNTGVDTTMIDIYFYRFSDGALVGCRRVTDIAPGTSYADIPNKDGDLPGDTQFSVVIRSLVSTVVAVVNESRGTGATTQAASYIGVNGGARRVYLPNVTRHFYGYGVPFIVQNVGDMLTSVTASFTSFDRQQQLSVSRIVLPGRSTVFDPDALAGLSDGTQYSVIVTSDQPVAVVANAHNEVVGPFAYAHNGLTTGSPILLAPYVAKSGNGLTDRDSPVVIQNISDFSLDIEVHLVPLGATDPNTQLQVFHITGVPSLSAVVFDPRFRIGTSLPCFIAVPDKCVGPGEYSMTILASAPITAVVLPSTATTAAAYVAQPSTTMTAHVFLPNVTRNLGGTSGWSTPVTIQSDTATNLVLRWYRFADGSLAKAETRKIVAGTAVTIDPRTVTGLSDDAQYALDVRGENGTAVGKITAIVYELATGGDSAMIYEGFAGN